MMSFLARYWNVVERAVSETGMNAGDIKVDIDALLNNTDVGNTVVPPVTPENQTTEAPAKAGYMPDQVVMSDMARGLARPACEIETLETKPIRTRTSKKKERSGDSMGDGLGASIPRRPPIRSKKAKATKSLRKQLKKIGGGRKVNVILEKVVCDGRTVWSAPG